MWFEICLQVLTLIHRENILEPKIYTRTVINLETVKFNIIILDIRLLRSSPLNVLNMMRASL